jgi:hypothetical protein
MKVCIIGAGASGILLSLLLQQFGLSTNDFCIIDPHFDGGDLQRKWPNVISNTPWSATTDAFRRCLPSVELPKWAKELPPDQPTPLRTIAKLLRDLFHARKFQTVRGTVEKAIWKPEDGTWIVYVQSGTGITEINATRVLFAQGSVPKHYDMPIPSIPLEVALDADRIKTYVKSSDQVIVFGTNHSGIIVLKNLVDNDVGRIVGVHKGSKPFIWARDAEYEGLKLDGAAVADSIISGKYPSIRLVSYDNTPNLIRETRNATWVVYATGFQPDTTIRVSDESTDISHTEYDPNTGVLKNAPNAWGFGIAYPSQAPDGIHYDVGISSFLEHFHKQIPSILPGAHL